jgi:hypothetical protein
VGVDRRAGSSGGVRSTSCVRGSVARRSGAVRRDRANAAGRWVGGAEAARDGVARLDEWPLDVRWRLRRAAGPPPGNASGSVLNFGRYAGWSLGEIGRRDIEYLEWLDRMPIGRPYRDEIDALLRAAGLRRSADPAASERRGLFRRR